MRTRAASGGVTAGEVGGGWPKPAGEAHGASTVDWRPLRRPRGTRYVGLGGGPAFAASDTSARTVPSLLM